MKNRLRLIVLAVIALLLIPLIAMQFTNEVNWGLMDFLIAAFLLFSTGIILDLINKKISKPKIGILLSLIILLTVILIWAELAVGILGTPFSGS